MFAYCGNNPVNMHDPTGEFFFTVLGAVIGAVTGLIDSAIMGTNLVKGAAAGAASGAIAGAGVDLGVLITAATGGAGAGAGLAVAMGFGAVGNAVGTGISSDWKADPLDYAAAAIVGGITNAISFGLAPINGEIVKAPLVQVTKNLITEGVKAFGENTAMGTIVAVGTIWITRVIT